MPHVSGSSRRFESCESQTLRLSILSGKNHMTAPSKICQRCGRTMAWRKKWERNWDTVRYCSTRCRKTPLGQVDHQLELSILELLNSRSRASSICPSEAARRVQPNGWKPLMERTRMAARRLVAHGLIDMKQGGCVVDPSTAKGPIRLVLTSENKP